MSIPSQPHPPIGARRAIRLSPRGRQRFGEFLANGLLGAAAGVASVTATPLFTGGDAPGPDLRATGLVLSAALVAIAVLVRYTTEEREHEER